SAASPSVTLDAIAVIVINSSGVAADLRSSTNLSGIGITYNSSAGIRLNTTEQDQTVVLPQRIVDFVNHSNSPLRDELLLRLHTEQLDVFDTNVDGVIKVSELEALSGKTAFSPLYTTTTSRQTAIDVRNLVTALDSNKNGVLEVSEAAAFLSAENAHLATDADRFASGILTDARYFLISRAIDANSSEGSPYAVIEAHGDISLNGYQFAAADLRVSADGNTFRAFIGININLGPFGYVKAFGSLSASADGVAGMLLADISLGKSASGLQIGGTIIVQMNTSTSAATIDSYTISNKTGTVDTRLTQITLEPSKTLVKLGGYFTFGGSFTLRGETSFEVDSGNSTNCTFQFSTSLGLGNFGSFNVSGAARYADGVFAGCISLGVNAITRPLRIDGTFVLQINSGNTPKSFNTSDGSTTTTWIIPANTYQVLISASMKMYGFSVSGNISLGVVDGHFKILINNIDLDFFKIITVKITGHITDSDWKITGLAKWGIKFGPLAMDASMSITIGGTWGGSVYASATLSGKVSASVKIAGVRYSRTLADISANVSFSISTSDVRASASLRVKILGIVIKGSVSWSMQISTTTVAEPTLYSLDGDTLYLNMGSRAAQRGTSFADEQNESFSVLSYDPNSDSTADESLLYITAFGYTKTVSRSAVRHIVVTDAGDGDDYLMVDSDIDADVSVHAGTGDDVIYAYSSASSGTGNSLWGGSGHDVLRGGSGNDKIYGESGDDDLGGGAGADILDAGDGNNIVYGDDDLKDATLSNGSSNNIFSVVEASDDGNDTITVGNGQNIIFGGAGDDLISVSDAASSWNPSRETPVIRRDIAGQTIWLPQLSNSEGSPVSTGGSLTVNGSAAAGTLFFQDGLWKYTFSQSETNTETLSLFLSAPTATPLTLIVQTTLADTAVFTGSGSDSVTWTGSGSSGKLFVSGAAGTDKLRMQNNYSGLTIIPGQQTITVGAQQLSFNTSVEEVELVDAATTTVLATTSASSMQFDSVNFSVQATGVADLRNAVINIASGKFTLTSAGVLGVLQTSVQSLEVSNSGTGSEANVVIADAGDLRISGSGISSNGGTITVTASPAGGGSITMDDSVVINSGAGNVVISAPGNITLSSIQTTIGTISITSTFGAILNGSTQNTSLVGHSGSTFALRAVGGIGTPTAPLQTAIPVLAFQNTTGNVNISNIGGLRIASVDGLSNSTNTGTTTLVATTPIVFAVSTTQTALLVQATESAPANYDSITVNAGVTVTATSGNLVFEAGDSVLVAAGATV
ncbi:MAG: beta strand repeat-containing protein, partial [Planctomyces sp.]